MITVRLLTASGDFPYPGYHDVEVADFTKPIEFPESMGPGNLVVAAKVDGVVESLGIAISMTIPLAVPINMTLGAGITPHLTLYPARGTEDEKWDRRAAEMEHYRAAKTPR
jgi:hypothetical protein